MVRVLREKQVAPKMQGAGAALSGSGSALMIASGGSDDARVEYIACGGRASAASKLFMQAKRLPSAARRHARTIRCNSVCDRSAPDDKCLQQRLWPPK